MIIYNNELFIREELNGVTVYEKATNLYMFYEGLEMNVFEGVSAIWKVKKILSANAYRINRNISFSMPFRVNWLIEEKCNLDCIYCFANDKMQEYETKDNILATAKHILNLGIINVGISGGEPTLSPFLEDILESFNGKCSLNIDTNGTLSSLRKNANLLKQANALVRITLDATEPELLAKLRPSKNPDFDQLSEIYMNITELQQVGVPLMVHTVITKYNIGHLEKIAVKLVDLGVKRWHLYGVNYSEKCKDFYDSIKVTNNEIETAYLSLKEKYGDKINMSVYFDEGNYSANSVILIDSKGRFILDSIKEGISYIGNDPRKPTLAEIKDALDIKMHCFGYLWIPDLI